MLSYQIKDIDIQIARLGHPIPILKFFPISHVQFFNASGRSL